MVKIGNDWDEMIQEEFQKEYYIKLREFLSKEYQENTIYPPAEDLFNALRYSSYSDTKAVSYTHLDVYKRQVRRRDI